MNLKQSDKLIAIIGVIILIIAGIAIIFYTSAEVDEEDVYDPNEKIEYNIYWEEKTGKGSMDGTANPSLEDTIMITTSTKSVITKVSLNVIWEDDNVWGLLKNKGKDTLKVEIKPEGGSAEEAQSTGSGNMSFDFSITSKMEKYVDAKDIEEAEDIIMNDIEDYNKESFDITVTVNTGERFRFLQPIRSLLNKIRDNGNDFEIEYTYTYYTFDIEEPDEDDNDDDKTTGFGDNSGSNGSIGNFYINIAYGRGFI